MERVGGRRGQSENDDLAEREKEATSKDTLKDVSEKRKPRFRLMNLRANRPHLTERSTRTVKSKTRTRCNRGSKQRQEAGAK